MNGIQFPYFLQNFLFTSLEHFLNYTSATVTKEKSLDHSLYLSFIKKNPFYCYQNEDYANNDILFCRNSFTFHFFNQMIIITRDFL